MNEDLVKVFNDMVDVLEEFHDTQKKTVEVLALMERQLQLMTELVIQGKVE